MWAGGALSGLSQSKSHLPLFPHDTGPQGTLGPGCQLAVNSGDLPGPLFTASHPLPGALENGSWAPRALLGTELGAPLCSFLTVLSEGSAHYELRQRLQGKVHQERQTCPCQQGGAPLWVTAGAEQSGVPLQQSARPCPGNPRLTPSLQSLA